MIPSTLDLRGSAAECNKALPDRIRDYLRNRGIADVVIDAHLLGWNGTRITIPISNLAGQIAFFKLAKDPNDTSDRPKMLATPGAHAELYGWERLAEKPEEIIICEGEFDRLVLEGRGFSAVTSTGGAGTFRPEWAEAFREIPKVFVCFDRDDAGERGAERVARLMPYARVVRLPDEVGVGGDVTDFFVRLGRSRDDFIQLLEASRPLTTNELSSPMQKRSTPEPSGEASQLKSSIQIEDIVRQYLSLRQSGRNFVANCPFHIDKKPSFVIFPATQSFFCFGCRAHGDVLTFLMRIEHLTFAEALRVCRRLTGKYE